MAKSITTLLIRKLLLAVTGFYVISIIVGPLAYLAFGLMVAGIVAISWQYRKHLGFGGTWKGYMAIAVIDILTWPDAILTHVMRSVLRFKKYEKATPN